MKIFSESARNKITSSRFVSFFYKAKTYFNIGGVQLFWITSKIPEIAGVVTLLSFFKIQITQLTFISAVMAILIGLILLGYTLSKTGIYGVEIKTNAAVDPVQSEIYLAAKRYNEEYDNKNLKNIDYGWKKDDKTRKG